MYDDNIELNAEIISRLPVSFTVMPSMFTRLGCQVIWDIFDEVCDDRVFTAPRLVGKLPSIAHYNVRTQAGLIRTALQYLEAEGALTGEPQVVRLSKAYWRLRLG